jgi:hypothetical protein
MELEQNRYPDPQELIQVQNERHEWLWNHLLNVNCHLEGVKKIVVVSELFVGKEFEKGKITGVKIFAGGSLVREGVVKRNWVLSKTT